MAQRVSAQIWTPNLPLDAKSTPVETMEELAAIPMNYRYIGLTITVLNSVYDDEDELVSQNPVEYWLIGGIQNRFWKIKHANLVPTKADLLSLSSEAVALGFEMVVQQDESNDGKVTKYWVTAIDGSNVTWSQKQYGGGEAHVIVDGEDIESED